MQKRSVVNELDRLRQQLDDFFIQTDALSEAADELRTKAFSVFEQVIVEQVQLREIRGKV